MSRNPVQKAAPVFAFLAGHVLGPRTRALQILIASAAWICLLGISFITLSPIGIRPDVGEPHIERFIGFAVLAFLFATAYPRRLLLILTVIIGTAIILEISQSFTGDRHAKSIDVLVKILGAVFGAIAFLGAKSFLELCLARYGTAQGASN